MVVRMAGETLHSGGMRSVNMDHREELFMCMSFILFAVKYVPQSLATLHPLGIIRQH